MLAASIFLFHEHLRAKQKRLIIFAGKGSEATPSLTHGNVASTCIPLPWASLSTTRKRQNIKQAKTRLVNFGTPLDQRIHYNHQLIPTPACSTVNQAAMKAQVNWKMKVPDCNSEVLQNLWFWRRIRKLCAESSWVLYTLTIERQ